MSPQIRSLLWPAHQVPEAVEALAGKTGIARPGSNTLVAPVSQDSMDEPTLLRSMEKASAVLGVAPAFVAGRAPMELLAVAFGGILLAYRALRQMVEGITYLAGAVISWKQVAPLFHIDASEEFKGNDECGMMNDASSVIPHSSLIIHHSFPALTAHNLTYRYREREEPVLRDLSVEILHGERVLLQGASGGGKSTFISLLSGVRKPASGLLLVSGIDYHLLDSGLWRKRVVLAPQFHENHVFTGALAMNLLMGRRWPPTEDDLLEAEQMCRELGLDDLLDRIARGDATDDR